MLQCLSRLCYQRRAFNFTHKLVRSAYLVWHDSLRRHLAVLSPTMLHVLCVDTGRSSETAKAHRG
eukprot:TRINITY_DN2705_c0_g1_i1.p1 TRINITY_DN2705_c0_g1~~TRINITY_DN2705_c0_g1_i1.p1  ORF type:complete len:65 (+),score=8.07 TRINITY_DN2705_c0_g1_i1:41-235(+)